MLRYAPGVALAALVLTCAPLVAQSAPPSPTELAELERIARARLDSARMRFTPADVAFMQGMIGHHAQAVLISGWAESHGASPSIRTLAARIINAQQDEIVTMQTWLRDRNQPVPEADPSAVAHAHHAMEHAEHDAGLMPGMLTAAQLEELDAARGPEFDRLFLTYMIAHHRGATKMVADLFAQDGSGQDEAVFKFASDVNVDQTTEIDRMELMLAALARRAGTR